MEIKPNGTHAFVKAQADESTSRERNPLFTVTEPVGVGASMTLEPATSAWYTKACVSELSNKMLEAAVKETP